MSDEDKEKPFRSADQIAESAEPEEPKEPGDPWAQTPEVKGEGESAENPSPSTADAGQKAPDQNGPMTTPPRPRPRSTSRRRASAGEARGFSDEVLQSILRSTLMARAREASGQANVRRVQATPPVDIYSGKLQDAHVEFLGDITKQRRHLLIWAQWVTSLLLVFTCVMICWIMWTSDGHPDSKLFIAWISAVLAACIGIVASIAKFLFGQTESLLRPLGIIDSKMEAEKRDDGK